MAAAAAAVSRGEHEQNDNAIRQGRPATAAAAAVTDGGNRRRYTEQHQMYVYSIIYTQIIIFAIGWSYAAPAVRTLVNGQATAECSAAGHHQC